MRTHLTAGGATRPTRPARAAAALLLSFALALFAPPPGVRAAAVDLDEGFGGDGMVTTDLGGVETAYAVAVRPDGKLLVLGESRTGDSASSSVQSVLLRYNPDGSTDASFGGGGKAVVDFPGFPFFAFDLALQPDGKIVLAGAARSTATNSDFGFGVARFHADGTPDSAFGAGGLTFTDFSIHSPARAVALQADGKIVVAGVRHFGGERSNDFAVVRYLPDGSPDASFGAGGAATADFGLSDAASDVLVQPDGKLLLAGDSHHNLFLTSDFALARFNPDGSPDTTFDADGRVTTSFSSNDFATGLALKADGKIVAAGITYGGGTGPDFVLACYNPDGSTDASFGAGGKAITDFEGEQDWAQAVAVRPDGRIVAVGYSYDFGSLSPSYFAAAFYLPDGTHDNSFGAGGRLRTRFPGSIHNFMYAMALQPDGKVVAAGEVADNDFGPRTDIALARYDDAGGTAQTSFVRFAAEQFAADEGCAPAVVTVTREGDLSAAATVTYRTRDGSASQRSDYTHATGTLDFAPGQSSRSFHVLVNADAHAEAAETFFVELVGASPGVNFRRPDSAALSVNDTGADGPATNPIDDPGQFVCQQYHDFLSRQPDNAGLAFWTGHINACGGDPACVGERRENVSTAFFLSIEFQQTGYFVIRTHKAALGDASDNPRYLPFLRDAQRVGRGVQVGVGDWAGRLEENKDAFALEFVRRAEFVDAHGAQDAGQYVDSLFTNAGVTPTAGERAGAVAAFGVGGDGGRARALRAVVESGSVYNKLYNPAFVLMQYFGYMRRNPDDFPDFNFRGYDFWLEKLDSFSRPGEDVRDERVALGRVSRAQMVQAFITSIEYRQRFAP